MLTGGVVRFMHSANVIHRDLKPNNLLVNINCDLKARGGAQRCFVWVCGSYVGSYAGALMRCTLCLMLRNKREPLRLCAFCAAAVLPPCFRVRTEALAALYSPRRISAHFLSSVRRHQSVVWLRRSATSGLRACLSTTTS